MTTSNNRLYQFKSQYHFLYIHFIISSPHKEKEIKTSLQQALKIIAKKFHYKMRIAQLKNMQEKVRENKYTLELSDTSVKRVKVDLTSPHQSQGCVQFNF